MIRYEVQGMAELERNLKEFPAVVSAKWVNGGLRSGISKIYDKAVSLVPVRTKTLQQSIRIRRGKKQSDDDKRDYFLIAGNRKKGGGGAFYAHMVERGTKKHAITPQVKKAMAWENVRTTVMHPGTTATRFVERSFQDQGQQAVIVFGNYIRNKLQKSGKFNPATETE